jgi:hypothetical protein
VDLAVNDALPGVNVAGESRIMSRALVTIVTTLIVLSLPGWATPATAYVLQIITSIPAASAQDDSRLKDALKTAFADILEHAIVFRPTILTVRDARVVGDRIYLLVLVADHDGEETIKSLLDPNAKEGDQP